MKTFKTSDLVWTRQPKSYEVSDERVIIETLEHTDLWQRTFYHFQNDNAPVLQMTLDEDFFSFTVKTPFPQVIALINVVSSCIWTPRIG